MESGNSVGPGDIYDTTAQTRDTEIWPTEGFANTAPATGCEPEVLVELVVMEGPEGEELYAMQIEVVRRILTRLAETQKNTKEGSL
jgi:hypothetical protein